MSNFKEARSGINPANIQEILDASTSKKTAMQQGQNQYQTPPKLAAFLSSLLPKIPDVAFDPQCAQGNTLTSGGAPWSTLMGFEIDRRFEDSKDRVNRVIGNCVKAWEVMEDVFPELKFECQTANPPFAIGWAVPGGGSGKCDSTEYTWKKLMQHAENHGYGWCISNWKTIERLEIHKHPSVYLYQKFPKGQWEDCDVEIGVVHFDNHAGCRPERQELVYTTSDLNEHKEAVSKIVQHYKRMAYEQTRSMDTDKRQILEAWPQIQKIVREEGGQEKPFNVYLSKNGELKTYLSTRAVVKRKMSQADILAMNRINGCHPFTLTPDRDTRKLLEELVNCGLYTIEPAAKDSINEALLEVNRLQAPLMPVTDFECVAYAEQEEHLLCTKDWRGDDQMWFTSGRKYEISTGTYSFREQFKRIKPHEDAETGRMYSAVHECERSGEDKYISVTDDRGTLHRFMDKPTKGRDWDHPEEKMWSVFQKPIVLTVAETNPKEFEKNKLSLRMCELVAGFQYYPGQVDYTARVAVKDHGVVAADTGVGKSLIALSLIQIKGPARALIIAPQGTMRSSESDEDDEEEEEGFTASQWLQEIGRFAPGNPVFQLFDHSDYIRIKKQNKGVLPHGIYVSYYQAMFTNGARETAASSWNDDRLKLEMNKIVKLTKEQLATVDMPAGGPEDKNGIRDGGLTAWCQSVGQEKERIRCIMSPCMSTLISHEFDFVAMDEAHVVCNPQANITQMLIRMQPKYRYLFTATPIPNIVSNLFSLMGWVCVPDWYKGNLLNAAWPFRRGEIARFNQIALTEERDFTQERMNKIAAVKEAAATGAGIPKSFKCVKLSPVIASPARVLKLLKPNMAYIDKQTCNPLYLPPNVKEIRVPMGVEQTKLYVHFMNRRNIPCAHPLIRARKQIAWLRGICADPAHFEHGGPKVSSNFNPKVMAILQLTREIMAMNEQIVLINSRVGLTDTLHLLLREAGVKIGRIDSTVSASEHSRQSNLFKAGRSQVLLMGIKCAASYSFNDCKHLAIGSLEYSYGSLHQAMGRIDRVCNPSTNIYCILHQHTIEETMYDVVATKQDAATICLRGQRVPRDFKPVDMSEVLAMSFDNFRSDLSVDEEKCRLQWPVLKASFAA